MSSTDEWPEIEIPDYVEPRSEETQIVVDPVIAYIDSFKDTGKIHVKTREDVDLLEKAVVLLQKNFENEHLLQKLQDHIRKLSIEYKQDIYLLSLPNSALRQLLQKDESFRSEIARYQEIESRRAEDEERWRLVNECSKSGFFASEEEKNRFERNERFLQVYKRASQKKDFYLNDIEQKYSILKLRTDPIRMRSFVSFPDRVCPRDEKRRDDLFLFLEEASFEHLTCFLMEMKPYMKRWDGPRCYVSNALSQVLQKLHNLYRFYSV